MNTRKLKRKNDMRHYGSAMPLHGLFDVNIVSKRKNERQATRSEAPHREKLKYALHTDLFLCFTASVNRFKKTP